MTLVGVLHKAGIPIVAGTDQSVPGFSLHREIELYVQAGFTPLEALQSATIVPARVMKQDGNSGTVEAGKRGDLVILDADPLVDIRNTRKIYRVITNGRVFDPAPLCGRAWGSGRDYSLSFLRMMACSSPDELALVSPRSFEIITLPTSEQVFDVELDVLDVRRPRDAGVGEEFLPGLVQDADRQATASHLHAYANPSSSGQLRGDCRLYRYRRGRSLTARSTS